MGRKKRRNWTPQQKLKIVLESMQSDRKLAEICRQHGVSPNQVYDWRKQLLGSAEAVFARKPRDGEDAATKKLSVEYQRMKDVVAEITAENIELKKTLSD